MVQAPVAKGLFAAGSIAPTLFGAAIIGGGAYYLYKRYGKKDDEQAIEGEVVEQSQEAEAAAA